MLAPCPLGKNISSECLWDSGRRTHKLCEKRQKVGKEEEEEGKEGGHSIRWKGDGAEWLQVGCDTREVRIQIQGLFLPASIYYY